MSLAEAAVAASPSPRASRLATMAQGAGGALALVVLLAALYIAAAYALRTAAEVAFPDLDSVARAWLGLSAEAGGCLVEVLAFWWLLGRSGKAARRERLALLPARIGARGWIGIVIGLFVVKVVATMAITALVPKGGGGTLDALRPFAEIMKSPAWPMLVAFGALGAVAEELIFRGYLSRSLEASRLGVWGGALAAAVVWAAAHPYYPFSAQAVLVVLGVGLSCVRRSTGSLWPGMVWHILNNVIALTAMKVLL